MIYEKLKIECKKSKGFEPGMASMILEAQKSNPKESNQQLADRINMPIKRVEEYLELIERSNSISGEELQEVLKNTNEVENV